MNKLALYSIAALFFCCNICDVQGVEPLQKTLHSIASAYQARIGIALTVIEDNSTVTVNNRYRYPMQSVYKFPLALAVLHQVDQKKLSLDQKIHIGKDDLKPNTWSPLREKYPQGNLDLTLADLLEYTVSQSDNNTCDVLFRLMNGTTAVERYIHGLGIKNIAIQATEEEMAKGFDVQYTNWTEPLAMTTLLKSFFVDNYLSEASRSFLFRLMVESSNSSQRLKGLLPENIVVAHKTGTGNSEPAAIVNDVGIITLPDGRHIALSVFIDGSKEKFEINEKIIATISKTVFDFYSQQSRIAARIDSLISAPAQNPFNGIILISQNEKTVYSKVVGYSDVKMKIPLKFDDQFVIGSVSKQFTAVLVLQELEKGHIKLDVPIRTYLPELSQRWADTITIYHLLTHTHGLVSLNEPTTFKVGARMDYERGNNIGYDLLATIIERTSHNTFAKLSADLFKKCGMKNTFHPDIKNYTNLVGGHTQDSDGNIKFDSNSFRSAPAAGCFISTARDLIIWNKNLHGGKLLKPQTYSLMVTKKKNVIRQHPLSGPTEYGFGITVTDKNNLMQLGQTGFAPGFASMNYYFPETKTSAIVLQNIAYNTEIKNRYYYHIKTMEILHEELKTK